MDLDDATDAATRLLRRRPTEVLPPFVADAATGVVAQTVGLAALAVALVSLQGTGRLEQVTDAVTALTEGDQPTPEEFDALVTALEGLFTPTVTAVLVVGLVVGTAAVVVVRAAVGAAKTHAARVAVREARGESAAGRPRRPRDEGPSATTRPDGGRSTGAGDGLGPLTAAVEGVFADTRSFAGVTLLRLGLLLAPFAVVAAGGPFAVLGALLVLPALLVAYLGFLFAPEAIVVDGEDAPGAVWRSVTFLRERTGRALTYAVLEVGVFFGTVVGAAVFSVASVGRLANLLALLFLLPWLGLVRMGLYLPARRPDAGVAGRADAAREGSDAAPAETAVVDDGEAPAGPDGGVQAVLGDLRGALGTGVGELGAFLRTHPALVGVGLAAFAAGAGIGRAVGPRAPAPITGDPTAVFGTFPVGTAINLTANNWQVAIAESFAGLALGVPTLANLLFNGLVVGATSGLFDPVAFAALIVPHGVIEVPALAVGGALGLHLAREGYRVVRGQRAADEFAATLHRAFLVLLGLLPVFAVAGVVEAFVTPLVAGFVLG